MSGGHALARLVRRWHARLGVAAALLFGLLAASGIALNHTDGLGLAHIELRSPVLARWYGVPPPRILAVVRLDAPLVATDDAWRYRDRPLPGGGGAIIGAVHSTSLLAVATAQSLTLYTPAGERIDTLAGDALPGHPIRALGLAGAALVVHTPRGMFASPDGLDWRPAAGPAVRWSRLAPAAAADRASLPAPALPLERVLLDLHSGRLFGHYGPWVMDAAALVLLGLSVTGAWMQWRGWRQKTRHPHARKP